MSKECERIHCLFNSLPRFTFPFNAKDIPQNGIYILFEKNENAHGMDRIVRIGTHTGQNQLPSRLLQHFVMQNKDRSIFRKNIGRAILNKNKDSFLKIWELDLTSKEQREKYNGSVNLKKQKETEALVSDYIQNNFSFAVIPVDNKEKRLFLESRIISTISRCGDCRPSESWLGKFSPKNKILESGLWLVNELYKTPLLSHEISSMEEKFSNKKRYS